ncbi:MAG: ATP-binding protein [Minicystis sp.]
MSTVLVSPPRPPMKISLRHRLLAVAVFGLLSCVISLFALGRILSLNTSLRVERAREAVTTELSTLRREAPNKGAVTPSVASLLGMRGGYAPGASAFDTTRPDLDEPARREVAEAIRAAAVSRDTALRVSEGTDVVLVVGALPADEGSFAWVAYTVRPSPFMPVWRFIVVSLSLATLLLVGTALSAVLAVRRSARSLSASLAALATDLHAPVARPPVPELGDIADRIAELARELSRAQVDKERLGAELSQRERLAALGRVVTGVAHEVRNPLASIKLRVDLGRNRAGTPPQLAQELSFVSEEITRLDRLVADLLVVAGRRNGPRVQTALGALVERRAALLKPWAEERGVRVEVSGDAVAEVDADAVARAVDNLVRNAVEASPAGGVARVEVGEDAAGARVRVLDHGAGVDEGRVSELFEPFFTTKPEGTGLGLALSRAIAATHGGALTYDRRGGVTAFELTLPRAARIRTEAA